MRYVGIRVFSWSSPPSSSLSSSPFPSAILFREYDSDLDGYGNSGRAHCRYKPIESLSVCRSPT
jgi:hypothetical protein